MLRKIIYLFAVTLLVGNPVQAASLSGLMGIDAGMTETVPVLDDVGNPVLDSQGNPLTRVKYLGGSYFSMGADTPATGAMIAPGSAGGIILGSYQPFVLDPDEPHPAGHPDAPFGAGSGYGRTPTSISTALAPFSFFNSPTYVGINPVGYQSGEAHPAPSADVDLGNCVGTVCAMTAELSAWEVMWNGTAFEQGPRPNNAGPFTLAVGTFDTATNFYSIKWSSQIKGGSFNAVPGFWHLEGTLAPVPIVGALPLFASGIAGLMVAVRRRRLQSPD